MLLVDSSVYIHLLRGGFDPISALAEHFEATTLVCCDVVRCEVLRGIIRAKPRAELTHFFNLLVHVTMDHRAWQQTEELAWQLDRAGKMIPLTDVIIAICALRANAQLLTRDHHFELVPQLSLAKW